MRFSAKVKKHCFARNILMYNKKNTIRLADVGLAQVVRKYETVMDRSGTKEYQPPEVTKSSHEADIW